MANYSVIEYLGEQRGSKCGYCKQEDKYNSHGKFKFLNQIQII